MKAPDKIYRSYFYDTASELYQSAPATDADSLTEYIRKDLLLKWAKENQEKCFSVVEDDLWQEVIDKINEL